MSVTSPIVQPDRPRGDSERHARIVEAAQRAFVRLGFHATTMQNVADEAGMSAGNLYRYFSSKEALVEGLCSHDFHHRTANFLSLASRTDIVEALEMTLMENVFRATREKARLIVEMWAEAGRNPRIAQISGEFDAANLNGLRALFDEARSAGKVAATIDSDFVARTLISLCAGFIVRIALDNGFDRDRESQHAISIVRGLMSGATSPLPVRKPELMS